MGVGKVQKRNGAIVDFDINKIVESLNEASIAKGKVDFVDMNEVVRLLQIELEEKFKDNIPNIRQVNDILYFILIKLGFSDVAEQYKIDFENKVINSSPNVIVEVKQTIDEYLQRLDWRVAANSNQGYSLGGMILNTSGKVTANYWLSCIYPKEIGDAHRNGDYHIHDLDMLCGYCAGWSLRKLLEEGFNGVQDKVECDPPSNLQTVVAQIVNFFGTLQNEWAGAQAFSSFDTYLSPFVKKYSMKIEKEIKEFNIHFDSDEIMQKYINKRTYKYVNDCIQAFCFNSNIPSRWGTQTPFTNITLDWVCPEDLKNKRLKMQGENFPYTFGELQKEMDMINRSFIEIMTKGDAKGRVFTFPIPTYNITPEFDWDDPKTDLLFDLSAKYGLPYFQNFLNSDLKPQQVRSMCCRLQLDLTELLKRGNGLFGSAEMTGSVGNVTINAARIGYNFKGDKEGFFHRLEQIMDLAKASLEIKRAEITKWMERGLFPFTRRYLGTFHNHFSTIGILGVNEAVQNFFNLEENIATKIGGDFAEEVLLFMRKKLKEYQEETGNLYNLEATPAEGATHRFAKEDKKRYPKIYQAGTDENPFYTNSTQLPVNYTDDAFEALMMQDRFQTLYTGGTVLHLYMGERISDSRTCKELVKKAFQNFRLPYITISPTFSICPKHGYIEGEHDFCPKCDNELGIAGANSIDESLREPYTTKTI